jgi:PAS domain S-box-containing protein
MNPVAEQLTGWSFADAEGKPVKLVFNILDASSRKNIDDPFDTVIDTGQIVHLSENTVLVSKDETEYLISDSAAPIRDSSGNIRGMVLVFNDITERKTKDEQLLQSQKMDALGKLTGGIAHDFNNLLGVILGYSELLTPLLKDQSRPLRYAEQIHAAGERARKLTAKLLAFSRKETPEAAVTDVNQLIVSEQHMLEKTLTARVELKLQLEDNLWPVYLDQGQLRDTILNISINAMHAMPNGGRLTISTKIISILRRVTMLCYQLLILVLVWIRIPSVKYLIHFSPPRGTREPGLV